MSKARCLACRLTAILLLAAVIVGCGSRPTATQYVATPQSHPALAFPDDRSASGLTEYLLDGKDAVARSGGALANGTALVLDATAGGVEYGVYRFNPGTEAPDSVSVLLSSAVAAGAFVGLADYTTQQWDFSVTMAAQKTFSIDSGDYISPGGNIWVAVCAAAGSSATVDALSVRTIRPGNLPPIATFSTTPAVAPLTLNFTAFDSADPDGTIVEYAWDWDGDGLYDGFSDSPFAIHTFPAAALYNVTLRVTDDQLARATFTLGVASGNLPPVAVLSVLPGANLPPSTAMTLSAAGSSDPDGSIVMYEWDGDGNPGFEANTGSVPTYSGVFSPGNPGPRVVQLRVTDNAGAVTETSLTVQSQGWYVQNLGGIPVGSNYNSLAIVAGRPAIAYAVNTSNPIFPPPFGSDDGTLYFTIATDEDATGWSTPVAVDASGRITDVAMTVCDGCPCIAYGVDTDHAGIIGNALQLRFVRAIDASGTQWHAPQTLDASSNYMGQYVDLAVISGNPAIAYQDGFNFDLLYRRATDAQGLVWNGALNIDSALQTGYAPSLQEINGKPMVACYAYGPQVLRFAAAQDISGDLWNPAVTLDDNAGAGNTGRDPALAEVNGRPAIAYRDDNGTQLMYLRALDGSGTNWPAAPVIADTLGDTGYTPALLVVDGLPRIAHGYYNGADFDLLYATASDADGTAWGAGEPADTVDNVGLYAHMVALGNQPVVLYWEQNNARLRYARRY